MNLPHHAALLQRLRAARRAELEQGLPHTVAAGLEPEEHRSSLTQVHDEVRTVLVRIDAAEAAMRPILQLWASDPARGGAHLLAPDDEAWGTAADSALPGPTTPWPASASDEDLPDTLRPGPQAPA